MDSEDELVERIVAPHKKVSREVMDKDVERVIKDAHVMFNLCYCRIGMYNGGLAMAHPQIDDKDPLRFFVTKDEKLVINPEIIRHSNYKVDNEEGCLSFKQYAPTIVKRWQKCEVRYATIKEINGVPSVVNGIVENLSGNEAKMYQHEIDHLDGVLIYNINK